MLNIEQLEQTMWPVYPLDEWQIIDSWWLLTLHFLSLFSLFLFFFVFILYIVYYVYMHSMDDFILDNLYSRNKSSSQKIMSMLIRN